MVINARVSKLSFLSVNLPGECYQPISFKKSFIYNTFTNEQTMVSCENMIEMNL